MNPIYALLIMISLVTVTTAVWYITDPIGTYVISLSGDIVDSAASLDPGTAANVNRFYVFMGWCLDMWGPILDIVYVVWFLIFGTRVDTESDRRIMYG